MTSLKRAREEKLALCLLRHMKQQTKSCSASKYHSPKRFFKTWKNGAIGWGYLRQICSVLVRVKRRVLSGIRTFRIPNMKNDRTTPLRSCPIDYLCVVYTFGFSSSHRGGPRGPLLDITNFISVKVQTKRQWGTVIYIFSYVLHKFNSCLGATLRERYVLFNCRTTALWICEILLITSQKISLVRSTKPLRHNGQSFVKLLL